MLFFTTKALVSVALYALVIVVGFGMGHRFRKAAGLLFPGTATLGLIAVAASMWYDDSGVVRSKDLWDLAFWFLWGTAQEFGAKWPQHERRRRASSQQP